MLPDGTKLMSADDHVIEPADLWVDRVPERYKDRCPTIVEVDGNEAWSFNGEIAYTMMGSCRALPGVPETGNPGTNSANYDQIRPGCYDPVERLKDMDLDGVWGQLCFPNYARFAGHRFYLNVDDRDLGLTCLRTYNDYLLDEWCATDPDRLYGAAVLPLIDIDDSVAELKRVIDKGAKAIAFSENPTVLGLPSVHTGHWDPLWDILDDAEIPVCMHIGSSSRMTTTSADAPPHVLVSLNGVNSMMAATDWLFSGILEDRPNLKVMLSEGGAGWIPYLLERMDKTFHDGRLRPPSREFKLKTPPSVLFAEHVYVCLVDENFALDVVDTIGADNLLFEGDYPHGDGLFPENRSYLTGALAQVKDEDAVKIAETNLRGLMKV